MKMHTALPFVAVLVAGCGTSDHSRFYVLSEKPAATTRATAISPATTIALGAIQLPAALDRTSHTHQRPVAVQLLALQVESEQAFAVGRLRVWIKRHPSAAIPQQHGPGAILALGNDTLELAVLERVVLDMDGKALLSWVEARPSRYRPTLEHAVHLQAKIIMQAPRSVLLHDKAQRCRLPRLDDLASRFRGL